MYIQLDGIATKGGHHNMKKMTVEKDIWIRASRERVWTGVTTAEQLRRWWNGHWEIDALEQGAMIKFGDSTSQRLLTVEEAEAPTKFVFRWPSPPIYGGAPILTILELWEENGGTRVKMLETGFEALAHEAREIRFARTSDTYGRLLAELKKYIENED